MGGNINCLRKINTLLVSFALTVDVSILAQTDEVASNNVLQCVQKATRLASNRSKYTAYLHIDLVRLKQIDI